MNLHTRELPSLQDYATPAADEAHCAIPLFHGTRAYALQATPEDRARFYAACDRVMTFAQKLANKNELDETQLLTYQRENNKFLSVPVFLYKKATYEYGDLYLSSAYTDALIYADCAGGELGEYAYAQCVGFEAFDIALNDELRQAAAVVREEHKKYYDSEKVVLIYDHIAFKDLQDRNGAPFLAPREDKAEEKELHDWVIQDLYDSEDSDTFTSHHHLRLIHPASYTASVIREKDLRGGFALFTDIKKVDPYIQKHQLP